MKTLLFPKTESCFLPQPLLVDKDKLDAESIIKNPIGIDCTYIAPEDIEIRYYNNKDRQELLKANKGDIIVCFYNNIDVKHQVIVVKNKEWKDNVVNIEACHAAEQAKLETRCKWCENNINCCCQSSC